MIEIENLEVDGEDDGMKPVSSEVWELTIPEDKTNYLIERQVKVICFGNRDFITRWEFWSSFDTKRERNLEFKRLTKLHPIWSLRKRDYNPYRERLKMM